MFNFVLARDDPRARRKDARLRYRHYHGVGAPLRPVALATGAFPAAWLVVCVRRRRRAGTGLCASCGYDLRATPERCPECGAAAATGH